MEKSQRRRWKVWLVALVLFIVIIVLVAAAIVLLTGSSEPDNPTTNGKPISLESIMNGKLAPNRFNGTWISDNQLTFVDNRGNLMMYNAKTGEKAELLTIDHPIMAASFDNQLSADKKYILFAFDYHKIYRHSYSARYLALDLSTNTQHTIHHGTNETLLDLVVWGPQGNSLAFVQNNNVFYKKSIMADAVQLTHDGTLGTIYNGVPDWVYEEEIFSSNKALWFSEDGSHLAFAKFDDSKTRIMSIPFYGPPGEIDAQYARAFNVRYPKAGTANPEVSLFAVDLTDTIPTTAKLPFPSKLTEPILASVSFANKDTVAAVWMNRIQNESTIMHCGSTCREIYHYNENKGWVDMLRPLLFNSNGTSFFTILPKAIGEDSWRQIAMIQRDENEDDSWKTRYITDKPFTVTELVHWDDKAEIMWFMATSVNDSAYHHLYSTDLNGKMECFTCNIKHSSSSMCLYNEVSMSKEGSFVVIACLGPQIPEIYIYSKDGKKIIDWEKNNDVSAALKDLSIPIIRRLQVRVAPAPIPPAQVLLMIPPNVDLTGREKYPLLVNVYGGPDSYQVLEKWNLDWGASLVSRYNIIIALIDGRGSGLKGNNNLFAGYRNLGTVEINDQINVTRHLQDDLPYVDPERTCIWGWSYGGYASALALAHGGDTFSCAVSVAPVTDWIYYDSIYTERYMGIPTGDDNILGYIKSQLNTRETAIALSKKKFMLVHGTLDDNVHYQQSMMLSRVLQLNDILFTQMSYPDEDHGLSNVKKHLYHSIEQFLKRNLLMES